MNLQYHLEKLNHFKLVVDAGSFAQASRVLGQSQPTVMYSVSELEKVLGCKLVNRSRKGISPTIQGKILKEFADRLQQDSFRVEKQIGQPATTTVEFTIASHGPVLSCVLAPVIKTIKKKFNINLEIMPESSSQKLLDMTYKYRANMVIVAEPKGVAEGFKQVPVMRFCYQAFCSPSYHKKYLSSGKSINLNDHPLLFLKNAIAGGTKTMAQALDERGVNPLSEYRFDDLEQVKSFAIHGEGVAILPSWFCQLEVKSKLLKVVTQKREMKNFAEQSLVAVFPQDPFTEALVKYIFV